jgi:hypothetical protein
MIDDTKTIGDENRLGEYHIGTLLEYHTLGVPLAFAGRGSHCTAFVNKDHQASSETQCNTS